MDKCVFLKLLVDVSRIVRGLVITDVHVDWRFKLRLPKSGWVIIDYTTPNPGCFVDFWQLVLIESTLQSYRIV